MLLVCKYAFNVSRPLFIFFIHHYEGDTYREEWSRNVEWGEGTDHAGEGALSACRQWRTRNRGGLLAQLSAPRVQKLKQKRESWTK